MLLTQRLAEARKLVGEIRRYADNTYWTHGAESQAQLRSVLRTVSEDLPAVERLANTEWNLTTYQGTADVPALQQQVAAARTELEEATSRLE